MVYSALFIDELHKRLRESDYYKVKEEIKKNNIQLKEVKRKSRALDKLIKLTQKYDLDLRKSELNNENILIIRGIEI